MIIGFRTMPTEGHPVVFRVTFPIRGEDPDCFEMDRPTVEGTPNILQFAMWTYFCFFHFWAQFHVQCKVTHACCLAHLCVLPLFLRALQMQFSSICLG